MSHPFGDLLLQFRARKRGLSQTRLAHLAGYDPAILARMCQGQKDLTGPSGRDRVVRVIEVLHKEGALTTLDEANALLATADMPPLYAGLPVEAALIQSLSKISATYKMTAPRATKPVSRHDASAQPSHPFGDLVSQHLHRRHGLSQAKLAEGILQAPPVVTAMCQGKRLTGPQARERVIAIISWLHQQGALDTVEEANSLLNAAGMAALSTDRPVEAVLIRSVQLASNHASRQEMRFTPPFNHWLRERRKQLDLTQGDLARRVGYSPETIRKIEAGVLKPSKQMVDLLADHLGIPSSQRDAFLAFATDSRTAKRQPRPSNLPAALTSFIGRDNEIADLVKQVKTTRLLTLTGSGGVGKSRLALEVARQLPDAFVDGVWLVELAPLSDPGLVAQTVANILKLPEQPDRTHLDVLIAYLEHRQLLLILDNCEHLIEACAALAEALLQRCPRLHILATSREMLRVPGEVTHRVPSLTTPDGDMSSDDLLCYESVRLFRERAITSQSAFEWSASNAEAVAQICTRLDGIPLAIELATARLSVFTAEQIADRLTDRFNLLVSGSRTALPRHQTLRAAIAWSYDLLSPPEQTLLMQLSVFAGGFSAEAAEFVSGQPETLTLLSNLVDKSLVIAELKDKAMRYRLLETIRQFAYEELIVLGEVNETRHRHAKTYLALAQAAEPHLHKQEQKKWLDQLEREHDNFRAALQWSLTDMQTGPNFGLRLAVALWQFWWLRGHFSEGGRWIDELRMAASSDVSVMVRAWACLASGLLSVNYTRSRGFAPSALPQFEEAWLLFQDTDDESGKALSLCEWGMSTYKQSHPGHTAMDTLSILQRSREISHLQHQQPWITVRILVYLAFTWQWLGDLSQAAALCDECVLLARQEGDAHSLSTALILLSDIVGSQLQFSRAANLAEEALFVARELGDKLHELSALRQFADALRFIGEFDRATALIEEMYALSLDRGFVRSTGVALTMLGLIMRDQGDNSRATAYLRESILWYRDKMKTRNGWNMLALGTVACAQGQFQRAAHIYGAVDAWQSSINLLRQSHNQLQFGSYIETTRARLGEAAYNAAFEEGRAMSHEQAVAYALAEL